MHTKEILEGFLAVCAFLRVWWNRLAPILTPIVKEVEADALAGKIQKEQRKQIVMDTINAMQKSGIIKLNTIEQMAAPFIVDYIAQKLPDWEASSNVKKIIEEVQLIQK
jgi:hypothetical protein